MKFEYAPMVGWRKTSGFGQRNTGIQGASTNHSGIDGVGRPPNLILVRGGKLVRKWWNDYRGWACLFDIGEGYHVLYQHMKYSCPLAVGAEYKAGSTIGIMGNSRSEKVIPIMGVHLHFELHKDGKPIDPEPYITNAGEEDMTREEILEIVKEAQVVYKMPGDVPEWGRPTVEKYIKDGGIKPEKDGSVNLSHDLVRTLVIVDRTR